MKKMGGPECPPHLCQHGPHGPLPWHFRLPCPDHDKGTGQQPPTARQKVVLESLLPGVAGYIGALERLAADGHLTAEERGHLDTLNAWREKLKAEVPPGK